MDGHPNKKSKLYEKNLYSETRYAVIKWLEKELPKVSGDVVNISAGNWPIPKKLLVPEKIKSYKTADLKFYGATKNVVDFYVDVHKLPKDWENKWDCVLNFESLECYENPFVAVGELHRILKPGGLLLLSCPFAYRWFGDGSWADPKQNLKGVKDYWRPTKQGLELLTKAFSKVEVVGFGGTGPHDRFVHCLKAIK